MKHKRFFHAVFIKLVIVNMVLTLTACSLFSADSPVTALAKFGTAEITGLLQSANLSAAEKNEVLQAVRVLKQFVADWDGIGYAVLADDTAVERFESDFQNIVRNHTLIVEMVRRHEAEYPPAVLAKLKTINNEINTIADKMDQLRGDVHNLASKKAMAQSAYDKVPIILNIVKTLL